MLHKQTNQRVSIFIPTVTQKEIDAHVALGSWVSSTTLVIVAFRPFDKSIVLDQIEENAKSSTRSKCNIRPVAIISVHKHDTQTKPFDLSSIQTELLSKDLLQIQLINRGYWLISQSLQAVWYYYDPSKMPLRILSQTLWIEKSGSDDIKDVMSSPIKTFYNCCRLIEFSKEYNNSGRETIIQHKKHQPEESMSITMTATSSLLRFSKSIHEKFGCNIAWLVSHRMHTILSLIGSSCHYDSTHMSISVGQEISCIIWWVILVRFLIDILLGFLVSWLLWTSSNALGSTIYGLYQGTMFQQFYEYVDWLSRNPAGFKLNPYLSPLLSHWILYFLRGWQDILLNNMTVAQTLVQVVSVTCVCGLSCGLAAISDLIWIYTYHVRFFYVYLSKAYGLSISILKASYALLKGNPIILPGGRHMRYQYEAFSVCVASITFSSFCFLVPTIALYYLLFALAQIAIDTSAYICILCADIIANNALLVKVDGIFRPWMYPGHVDLKRLESQGKERNQRCYLVYQVIIQRCINNHPQPTLSQLLHRSFFLYLCICC
eukprot:TRINITY_DN5340_c1_g1_i16.p1 TRINITY_DN5340_c1_g1~~TRINITY_DN5340_c1_g1_i16.p1  ORF type:complete len:546 (+),score=84.56 TRINITY_DN5340_c1_g1_i16:74-1711(+)